MDTIHNPLYHLQYADEDCYFLPSRDHGLLESFSQQNQYLIFYHCVYYQFAGNIHPEIEQFQPEENPFTFGGALSQWLFYRYSIAYVDNLDLKWLPLHAKKMLIRLRVLGLCQPLQAILIFCEKIAYGCGSWFDVDKGINECWIVQKLVYSRDIDHYPIASSGAS